MSIIDNQEKTFQDALINALSSADSIDISVGYFYFSGFRALAEQFRDKKIRILVGLEIDPQCVAEIAKYVREGHDDLDRWQPRGASSSRMAKKHNYFDAFVSFMNDSDLFDDEKANVLFDLYLEKIQNGTLEIRKTEHDEHGKYYIIHNKKEFSQNGDFPGTVFMGSSNLTYRGLSGQGELNESYRDKSHYDEYVEKFEAQWKQSISIADIDTKEEFIESIKPRIWKFAKPMPYELYLRVLHEIFDQSKLEEVKSPSKITNGKFTDLEYQADAVKLVIDRLNKYDGALLADVVGLGKSVIASTVARNLDMKTIIIAPPHLMSQWEDYKEDFGIRGSKVYSSGNIKEVYERYSTSNEPILLILDEAHRYRNEDNKDYKLLHQVCRSNSGNKVLLLTATPFNNDPKDVFALIKLFQTPGNATIRSVDNLSIRYRELIQRYKMLRRDMRKDSITEDFISRESKKIADEQRLLIESILIRRSRLDLKNIARYREDLEARGIAFAEIVGPELLEYDLGNLAELYVNTLNQMTDNKYGYKGARYKPTTLFTDEGKESFFAKYKEEYGDIEDISVAQTNLADFMKRLLVMRFESSKSAFKSTLENIIESNKKVERWWDEMGVVPILKKGQLPDPGDYDLEDGDEVNALEEELQYLRENKNFIEINKEFLKEEFITTVRNDTKVLEEMYGNWFGKEALSEVDPKIDSLIEKIKSSLQKKPNKKIVIFSTYKDTVDYLFDELQNRGMERIAKYTSTEGTETYKKVIKENFDASYSIQTNDYDVLIATDALSEGFNLHRAGVIINYDIPYNPTRVIQRVGRINRINKKVFDTLEVYNCFPTDIGEREIKVKSISTLKIKLINAVVGSDTKTLTTDEELKSFFKDEFNRASSEENQLSWDTIHRERYEMAIKDEELFEKIKKLPRRSRIGRKTDGDEGLIIFGKKGDNSIFVFGDEEDSAKLMNSETALSLFEADKEEKPIDLSGGFNRTFAFAKKKLFAKHDLPTTKGRRADAINVLKALSENYSVSKDYCNEVIRIIEELDDIPDGTLKDIAQVKLNPADFKEAYDNIRQIVPETYVVNILDRSQKSNQVQELLIFAEEFKK